MTKALTYPGALAGVRDKALAITTGPEWLQALRARGLAEFDRQGVPTMAREEWKYTSLRAVSESQFAGTSADMASVTLPETVENSIWLVLVDGAFRADLSSIANTGQASIGSLKDAIANGSEGVKSFLGAGARLEDHPFAALATSLLNDGVFIHLPKSSALEPIVEIIHFTTGDATVVAPRVLIVAEENSSAKIVETYLGTATKALVLPVTEVFVEPYANVEHVRVQDESESTYHIALWHVRQDASSEYKSYNVAFGAALGRVDQALWLGGRHVTTRLDGVVVGRGTQVLDNHTRLDHAMPDGNSFEIYKQIVDDKATVVFNGAIFVHQDAQKTDAKQTNQTLLLSPEAVINSKPQLEIFADDVKCTHGATVGSIEDELMFYLRSRGIPASQASSLLVYAFAADVLELITIPEVRARLEARLFTKLS